MLSESMAKIFVNWYRSFLKPLTEYIGLHSYLSRIWWEMKVWFTPPSITHCIGGTEVTFQMDKYWKVQRFYQEFNESKIIEDMVKRLKNDDVFYDIGAHLGWQTCFAAAAIRGGNVVSVESHPITASRLREVVNDTDLDVTIIECALGDREAQVIMNEKPASNARITNEPKGGIQVHMVDGDTLLEREPIKKPTILKIDVEGAELRVLEGFSESILESCRLIYCEIHPNEIESLGGSVDELLNKLKELGFTIDEMSSGSKTIIRANRP